MQEPDGEDVGEEGGAVVDCRQVGGGGHVHSDVPAAACDGEEGGNEGGGFEHVGPWGCLEVLGF